MRRTNKVFRQKRIPYLGELVDSIFTAMPALSLFSLISTTIILYEVTKQYIIDYAPWMNIGIFFAALAVLFMPILLIVYKFILPSIWHFRSTQMSHLDRKVDILDEKVDKLLDRNRSGKSGGEGKR
jgi:hypothetical protein